MYQLSVCPHDTAKHMVEWFQFNTYLQRQLDCPIHFEPIDSFILEQTAVLSGGYQLCYANPLSACTYIQELDFIPIVKPIGLYDETLLVARKSAGIPEQRPLTIATASGELITHTLGLSLLEGLKIPQAECEFKVVDSHMRSIHSVLKEQAALAFVFNDTWHNLSESTRAQLDILAETRDQIAFHCFLIAPELTERKEEIQSLLVAMKEDPKGRHILESLGLQGFEPISEDAMDTLKTLMAYYQALYNSE
ncbi:phosphonate transport system substrate-binding protein [Sulfuritortus calidifontis]|uniref:Phosphonate transport system substrate-binding protein n=1 Tax=Sulfuritortus calidifontis TaxID=1914471 RepID=A0A4R3JY90_9PROT|nr:PhnD/SsuA/transferrin family substrate-binding protein [Sulfuritortus calidifontis]TCS73487.1 phosphonate transport system substrate-binding protein [Sulfuritortus calidifontis]